MVGVLSVPVLPCLPVPAASSRSKALISSVDGSKLGSRGFNAIHESARAERPRTPIMRVRADASLSEIAPSAAAVYGSLLLGGGLFAYTRNSSKGSLLGGLTGSVLMGAVFFLLSNPEMKQLGEAAGFGTALLFAALFGIRFAATKKVFPSAPLLLMSVVASMVFMGAYLQDKV